MASPLDTIYHTDRRRSTPQRGLTAHGGRYDKIKEREAGEK